MEKPETVETVSKRKFYIVAAVMAYILLIAEVLIWKIVTPGPHGPYPHFFSFGSVLLMANFLFSVFATDRFFKTLGLSRSGNSVESWERMNANSLGFVADNEVVEFVLDRSALRYQFCAPVLALPLCVFLTYCYADDPMWVLVGNVVFVHLVARAIQLLLNRDGCLVRANNHGFFGFPERYAFNRKLLPWSEIASCDIVTRHDTFGSPVLIVPVFKNELGTKVMSLSLREVPMECQERLAKYIKTKLPKPRVDFAEV